MIGILLGGVIAGARGGHRRRASATGLDELLSFAGACPTTVRAGLLKTYADQEAVRPMTTATSATAEMPLGLLWARPRHLVTTARAAAKTAVCLFKVFPMLPSRPLDWVTPHPVVEQLRYLTSHGWAEGDLYRPSSAGPHPGVVVCLGVVPFGVDHPQVPRLGEALARSGFAALLYWSPAMRDFRLDPADIEDIASAYEALLGRPDINPGRSGLLGTCVGGAFALMAASSPRIRERVSFVSAYAPYASMWTLARDIASASRSINGQLESWAVDPLTRKVYIHSVTALLEPGEAQRLRDTFVERCAQPDVPGLSEAGWAVLPLLGALDSNEAESALQHLPIALQQRLTAMSPATYVRDLRAPLIVLLHDRDDPVIPVGECRRLRDALDDRGVRYTEFTVFKHLDPAKGHPSPVALVRELVRFARALYPLFEQAAA
jgi:dienelactone hydrolase